MNKPSVSTIPFGRSSLETNFSIMYTRFMDTRRSYSVNLALFVKNFGRNSGFYKSVDTKLEKNIPKIGI